MPEILVATDADWILDEVRAALGGEGHDHPLGAQRQGRRARAEARAADLVVLDLQIGNMGGMATCMDIRLESGAGRLPDVGVLMLLDRSADVFLAQRCNADGWLIKPLDAFRLRRVWRTRSFATRPTKRACPRRSRSEGGSQRVESLGNDPPPHPAAALLADDEAGVGQRLGVVADGGLRLAERCEEVARAAPRRRRRSGSAAGAGRGRPSAANAAGQLARRRLVERRGEHRRAARVG